MTYLKVAALHNSDGDLLCDMCVYELDDGAVCGKKFHRIFAVDCFSLIALPEVDLPKYIARKLTQ